MKRLYPAKPMELSPVWEATVVPAKQELPFQEHITQSLFIAWCTKNTKCIGSKSSKFDVHTAVHHNIISTVKQTRWTNVSNIFIWSDTLHVSDGLSIPSSGVQDCTYSNRHMSNRTAECLLASRQQYLFACCMYSLELLTMDGQCCLLASEYPLASRQQYLFDICLLLHVQTWNSWWWTERPSETCRVSFQNK